MGHACPINMPIVDGVLELPFIVSTYFAIEQMKRIIVIKNIIHVRVLFNFYHQLFHDHLTLSCSVVCVVTMGPQPTTN